MELVVDGAGTPASRLADFTYTAEEATALHQEVFLQVKALLGTGRIHGDLSAYNVLMAASGPTIIDLPQVVEVAGNNNARQILRRDLRNLTEHLARFDARLLRVADCGDALFQHLQRGTLDSVTGTRGGDARAPQRRRWRRPPGARRRARSRRPRQGAAPGRRRADGATGRSAAPSKTGRTCTSSRCPRPPERSTTSRLRAGCRPTTRGCGHGSALADRPPPAPSSRRALTAPARGARPPTRRGTLIWSSFFLSGGFQE